MIGIPLADVIPVQLVSLASRPQELTMALDMLPCAPVDVLIADDDAQLRGSVRLLLEAQGLTCAEAADGPQTVALARRVAPRCVLLDLGMPGLDGFTVARKLRTDPRTAQTQVHCLTGRTDPTSRRQAAEAGCALYLTKPIDPTAVLAAVRGWSGLTRAVAEELLDWLEMHGYAPAAVTYAGGIGFAVRLPRPFGCDAQPESTAAEDECLPSIDPRGRAHSVQKPVPGRRARYAGVYRLDGATGHIAVRVSRTPTVLGCAVAALGLALCAWLGILSLLAVAVFATLLAIVLAIPAEERWLPTFAPEVLCDLHGGAPGRFGHRGVLRRHVQVLRIVRVARIGVRQRVE
jgi:two-component system cell cycle response regulator DivK